MEFWAGKTLAERAGEKAGKTTAFITFSIAAFFIAGKTGTMCWGIKKYLYFTSGLALALFLIDNIIRRLNGREKNKIIS